MWIQRELCDQSIRVMRCGRSRVAQYTEGTETWEWRQHTSGWCVLKLGPSKQSHYINVTLDVTLTRFVRSFRLLRDGLRLKLEKSSKQYCRHRKGPHLFAIAIFYTKILTTLPSHKRSHSRKFRNAQRHRERKHTSHRKQILRRSQTSDDHPLLCLTTTSWRCLATSTGNGRDGQRQARRFGFAAETTSAHETDKSRDFPPGDVGRAGGAWRRELTVSVRVMRCSWWKRCISSTHWRPNSPLQADATDDAASVDAGHIANLQSETTVLSTLHTAVLVGARGTFKLTSGCGSCLV